MIHGRDTFSTQKAICAVLPLISQAPNAHFTKRKTLPALRSQATHRKVTRSTTPVTFSFPKRGIVPAGKYRCKVVAFEDSRTKAGEEAVDALYELTSATGEQYHIRTRYLVDSYYYCEFCDALLDAGLKENSLLADAVGIEEEIVLDYPDGARIGCFTSRRPLGRRDCQDGDTLDAEDSNCTDKEAQVDSWDDDADFEDYLDLEED